MMGAIVGDVMGSAYEFMAPKKVDFELFPANTRFTDDSVLTVATAKAILRDLPYADVFRDFGRRYPDCIYGGTFQEWLTTPTMSPYNSCGNGSAMRVSPVGFAANTEEEALAEARRSAEVTHNHPEGIKGAQATALAIFLARHGVDREEISSRVQMKFGYDLNRTIEEIRPTYSFNESCQGTVPEALISVLDSSDFEHCIRLAISLGGDADTLACIAGGIAQALYGEVPKELKERTVAMLPQEFLEIIDEFERKFQ